MLPHPSFAHAKLRKPRIRSRHARLPLVVAGVGRSEPVLRHCEEHSDEAIQNCRYACISYNSTGLLRYARNDDKKKWEAERRETRSPRAGPIRGTAPPPNAPARFGSTRRGLASRRPTAALAAATERHRSAPAHALPGTELLRERVLPAPCRPSVQRNYPQAGRIAGRAFCPGAARERG